SHCRNKRREETLQLGSYLGQRLLPGLFVSRVGGIKKDRVSFDRLEMQGDVDLVQHRLDQIRNAELPMNGRELALDHKPGVSADIGQNQDNFLFARFHRRDSNDLLGQTTVDSDGQLVQ